MTAQVIASRWPRVASVTTRSKAAQKQQEMRSEQERRARELRSLRSDLAAVVPIMERSNRVINAHLADESDTLSDKPDNRPHTIEDIVGQEQLCLQLRTCLMGAMLRSERIPNLLLQGAPGSGKTSIAGVVAETIGAEFVTTSGPMLRKPSDLVGLIVKMVGPTVLFIEEAHSASKQCLEAIYEILEDGKVSIVNSAGGDVVAHSQDCPHVVVVAATNRPGLLPEPFRARCVTFTLDDYTDDQLTIIVERLWDRAEMPHANGEAEGVARRSKSNPRRCIALGQRVLDLVAVEGSPAIHPGTSARALSLFGIAENGMEPDDLRVIKALTGPFSGKSIGVDALSSYLNLDARTLSDSIEPWLCRNGFVLRGRSGRQAGPAAYALRKLLDIFAK